MSERGARGPNRGDEGTHLSTDDVERRLAGGSSRATDEVERRPVGGSGPRVMHVRPQRADARGRLVRDTLTILAAALVTVLGWQLVSGGTGGLQGDGSEAPGDTGIVIASAGTAVTLAPLATIGQIANASIGLGATPTPVPFATLGPGRLKVVVAVTNDNGGNDVASDWTITVSGAFSSPAVFAGSASGTMVAIDPSSSFSITTKPKTAGGYVETRSGTCSGTLARGGNATCTIAENDKPVAMTVKIVVKGGTATPGSFTVSVVALGIDKPTFKGSSTGTLVHFNANAKWTVKTTPASLTGYVVARTSGCGSALGAAEGASVSCTITFTYSATPTPTPAPVAVFSCVPSTGLVLTCTSSSTGAISSWVWNWGDGSTTSGQSPATHTYASDISPVTVTLTVTGPGGSNATSHQYTLVP